MTKLLFDFHWDLGLALDAYSEASGAFDSFENLRKAERLSGAPFLTEEEYAALPSLRLNSGGSINRELYEVLGHYIMGDCGPTRAIPANGPNDLRDTWMRALRMEMADLNNWRTPQIITCHDRGPAWAASLKGTSTKSEVVIRCEDNGETSHRVIVFLGPGHHHKPYYDHWYARSDRDPWDLQRKTPPNPEIPGQHPCRLPKPPHLAGVPLENLKAELEKIHNWEIDGKYYFIPPRHWQPEDFSQPDWRKNGETFQWSKRQDNDHEGPCDYKGDPWWWDEMHRHWDVQRKENYWSVSHTGRLIAIKDYH